jgi:predicted phosphoribosyltransferase
VRYRDRYQAGLVLADHLRRYAGAPGAGVLGLPRGGVVVASAVATVLRLPLDVLVVRKLGLPWSPEVAFGAVGGSAVDVRDTRAAHLVSEADAARVVARERAELARRETLYRGGRPPLDLSGQTAILVDDGLATGATARAAISVARRLGARAVVFAAPVGARDTVAALRRLADEVVCPVTPIDFAAVSAFFQTFGQVSDQTVIKLLSH